MPFELATYVERKINTKLDMTLQRLENFLEYVTQLFRIFWRAIGDQYKEPTRLLTVKENRSSFMLNAASKYWKHHMVVSSYGSKMILICFVTINRKTSLSK